jgi:hypothetical protein
MSGGAAAQRCARGCLAGLVPVRGEQPKPRNLKQSQQLEQVAERVPLTALVGELADHAPIAGLELDGEPKGMADGHDGDAAALPDPPGAPKPAHADGGGREHQHQHESRAGRGADPGRGPVESG